MKVRDASLVVFLVSALLFIALAGSVHGASSIPDCCKLGYCSAATNWCGTPVVTDNALFNFFATKSSPPNNYGSCQVKIVTALNDVPSGTSYAGYWPAATSCASLTAGASSKLAYSSADDLRIDSVVGNYASTGLAQVGLVEGHISASGFPPSFSFDAVPVTDQIDKSKFDDFSGTSPIPIFRFGFCGDYVAADYSSNTITPTDAHLEPGSDNSCNREAYHAALLSATIGTGPTLVSNPDFYFGAQAGRDRPFNLPLKRICTGYSFSMDLVSHGDWSTISPSKQFSIRDSTTYNFTYASTQDGNNKLEVILKTDGPSGPVKDIYVDGIDGSGGMGGGFLTVYCDAPVDLDKGPASYCNAALNAGAWNSNVLDANPNNLNACCGDDGNADIGQKIGSKVCNYDSTSATPWNWNDLNMYYCGSSDPLTYLDAPNGGCCDSTKLGTISDSGSDQAICTQQQSLPNVWTQIATEGKNFTVGLNQIVRYGAGTGTNTWITKTVSGTNNCSNTVFTDPDVGVAKTCQTNMPYEWISASKKANVSVLPTDDWSLASDGSKWYACTSAPNIQQLPNIQQIYTPLDCKKTPSCTTPNTYCNAGNCNCIIGYVWTGTTCVAGTATDTGYPCASDAECTARDPNEICSPSTDTCICGGDTYYDNTLRTCATPTTPETCSSTNNCAASSTCDLMTQKCDCQSGMTWSGTACVNFQQCNAGFAYNPTNKLCEGPIAGLTNKVSCNIITNKALSTPPTFICLSNWARYDPNANYGFDASGNYVDPSDPALQDSIVNVCQGQILVPGYRKDNATFTDHSMLCKPDQCWYGGDTGCVNESVWVQEDLCTSTPAGSAPATSDWELIANENGPSFDAGTNQVVRFGADTPSAPAAAQGYGAGWVEKVVTGTVHCTTAEFGDPAYLTPKTCETKGENPAFWTTRLQYLADALYNKSRDSDDFILQCDTVNQTLNNYTSIKAYYTASIPFVNGFCTLSKASDSHVYVVGTSLNTEDGISSQASPIDVLDDAVARGIISAQRVPPFLSVLKGADISSNNMSCGNETVPGVFANPGKFSQFQRCNVGNNENGSVWYQVDQDLLLMSNDASFQPTPTFWESLTNIWNSIFGINPQPGLLIPLRGNKIYVAAHHGMFVEGTQQYVSGGEQATVVYQNFNAGYNGQHYTPCSLSAGIVAATCSQVGSQDIYKITEMNPTQQDWEQLTLSVRP